MELNQIINGNAFEYINEVDKFFWGGYVIVIDPPFNIGYHYKTYKDKIKEETYFAQLSELIKDRPAVVVHYPEALHKLSIKLGYAPTRVISWVYNTNTPRQHRDIAFYNIIPDFTQVLQPYKNLKDKRIQQRIANGKLGCKLYDWLNINQVKNISKEKTEHPCQMPLELMEKIVGLLPKEKIIIDLFNGSGTTCCAAKKLGYKYLGFDIDESYCKIARERLEKIT